MVAVLAELGKGTARDVLAKVEGKTFNGVNATLAAAAGDKYGFATKTKIFVEELGKIATQYTITDAGREMLAEVEETSEETTEVAE